MQQKIAWNFECRITKKENAGDKSKLMTRDSQLCVHGQSGKTNINPVEKGDDVKEKEKRHQPARDAMACTLGDV